MNSVSNQYQLHQNMNQTSSLSGDLTNSNSVQNYTSTNGYLGIYNNPYSYPYYQPSVYYYTAPIGPTYVIKVEKVENGFIVHKDGQKFVVTEAEDIVKYLKDNAK